MQHYGRRVGIVMSPVASDEAPGVTIRRTIGSDKLVYLDPFLLHDHLTAAGEPGGREMGFPRHPHRGIETVTYVIRGTMRHADSLGNEDTIAGGESQYMTAGGGIYHSEMAAGDEAGHESIQIWTNLPASAKMTPPRYVAARQAEIPTVRVDGATVRVIAGTVENVTGPVVGVAVDLTYADVLLPTGAHVTLPARAGRTAYCYVYGGAGVFGADETGVEAGNMVIFSDGDGIRVRNDGPNEDVRFLLATANPLGEPVLQYRSLVMNTVEQMREAIEDLETGNFERGTTGKTMQPTAVETAAS